ncbi:hypothetical protein FB382_002530 [Nocardioides ginsengisegetis]|uniref:Gram-positive cocci surface proteins LPxTG domain-containing protein n=1 Tax=Nocardioides ginsengisegetis TaxID=661491 RepID=A0A7W3PA83_9ACTN|nr:hypothetical protein [Nocardioides ginsengisegetis]MBA8804239.1 hypothetical protein [Nocardioides ginsengisegetis]
MRLTLASLVAAVLVTAATGVIPAAPTQAAACSTASGVTVVVDFHELGGGVQQVCDAGGAGDDAATQFEDSGFALTRVQRQPGFVCRVNNAPSSDQESCVNTPPADAYWGLWWSDGTSGTWTYASQGVDSLTVPEGGYVALSWNGSSTKSPPGAAPTAHKTASPTPSPSPSHQPTQQPTQQPTHAPSQQPGTGGGTTAPASGATAPSVSASSAGSKPDGKHGGKHGQKKRHHASPSAGASSSATADPSGSASPAAGDVPAAEAPTPDDGGLPAWVAPAAIAVLFAAAGATALVRRRRAG